MTTGEMIEMLSSVPSESKVYVGWTPERVGDPEPVEVIRVDWRGGSWAECCNVVILYARPEATGL